MNSSAKFKFDVYRWTLLRADLQDRAFARHLKEGGDAEEALRLRFLLLTIDELHELAAAYPLDLSDVETAAAQFQVSLPGLVHLGLVRGAMLIHLIICFLVVYFWANLGAASQLDFPTPGTVFYVFSQGAIVKAIFVGLLAFPGAVSFLLLIRPIEFGELWVMLFPTTITILCSLMCIGLFLQVEPRYILRRKK